METTFLVIFTLLFLFFQKYGSSSSNTINVTCIKRERESLLVFRQGLIYESNRLSTWTGVECCEWQGVGCDRRNGHVVKLDLRSPLSFTYDVTFTTLNKDNWLTGEVSPSLLNLKHLRYLDLSMNNLSGHIPEFLGSFKSLEYLNLSHSGLGGLLPHHLGNLSRLRYLDLNYYYYYYYYFLDNGDRVFLTYDVSLMVKDDLRWLSLLSSLKHLDLSGINIGNHTDWFHPVNMLPSLVTLNLASCHINIPSIKFINFSSLNSLDLSGNHIHATIPVWLSNLTGLVHLNLQENYFHGRIPGFLGKLSSLASIDLSLNQFNTWMPDLFWNLSSLVHLDLSNNEFYGPIPPSLGGPSSLRVLNFFNNQLTGSIPESIGLLTRLQVLSLFENQLSGSIPESIGLLTRLHVLYLSSNQLSGSIPESIGLLMRLESLMLDRNQLSGNIPTSVGQLSNLQSLYVNYNSLVGVVSEIHFTKLNNLSALYLSDNSLTFNVNSHWIPPFQLEGFGGSSCNIGPQFPNWLQTQTNIRGLYLSNSSIRDRIPEWFENISAHIQYLDLSYNHICGRLPTMNPGLEVVVLAKNGFTGSVPAQLCELHSIRLLDLSQNNFFGILPDCLGSLTELRVIDLSDNTIKGDIPNSLGSPSYLFSLHLQNNKFEGNIPVSLQNLTSLVIMDLGNNFLTGNIPFWIGKRLSKLKILNLRSNKFVGKISLELCQIKALQHLNLANNSITGTIPRCFSKLTGMITISSDEIGDSALITYYEENIVAIIKGIEWKYTKTMRFLISLDLSNNNITGEIPNGLMNLVALNNLNLSRNLLSGKIPFAIGNLKQLESLDLSINKLFGRIPSSLASLTFLSYLNLSFNKLSGTIPVGNQLQTFNDPDIYEGNNGLCGSPLPRSCKGNNLSYTHVGDDEGKNGSQGLSWFYTGMVPGFVFGFMGFIGSLHFIRIWRVTYFEMIENVYAWLTYSILVTLARLRRKLF